MMPRIIINNVLGQNKVIYIDPFKGKSKDLNQKILEKQKGLKISGESVKIVKGTGPGAVMAIPTVPQQIVLMHSAAAEENFEQKQSAMTSLNKSYNVKVTKSTDRIGHLR